MISNRWSGAWIWMYKIKSYMRVHELLARVCLVFICGCHDCVYCVEPLNAPLLQLRFWSDSWISVECYWRRWQSQTWGKKSDTKINFYSIHYFLEWKFPAIKLQISSDQFWKNFEINRSNYGRYIMLHYQSGHLDKTQCKWRSNILWAAIRTNWRKHIYFQGMPNRIENH